MSGKVTTGGETGGVTVVIPAFNYAHFLPAAIDSALAQTHRPVEVLVVDDGSTDATPEVVAACGARVRCIRQANAGLSAARNTGIQNASHDFIGFLDADDQWLPERLAAAVEVFTRKGPGLGLVACRTRRINQAGEVLPANPGELELEGEITAADLLLRTRFSPSAVVARREVFAQCGWFDATLRSSEDRDMWLRAAVCWGIWLQPERLALIRRHDTNMSRHAGRMRENMRRVIGKAWRARAIPRHRLGVWLQALAIWRYQTSLIEAGLNRRAAAVRDLAWSLAYWPLPMDRRRIGARVSWVRLRALARAVLPARPPSSLP